MKRSFLVAAENGALPNGKVGGLGDVLRDLPVALAERGWSPTVLTPAYGIFNKLPKARAIAAVDVEFAGKTEHCEVFRVPGSDRRVTHLAFEHPHFSPQGPGKVYCSDDANRPFATDATKFAFFCAAAARYVEDLDTLPNVLHLNDWHAAWLLLLRHFDPALVRLRQIRTIFTIHNLALQGVRPVSGDPSSLNSWFPDLTYDEGIIGDPRYPGTVNPMATAIRLVDCITTVSPTYALEILRANNPALGIHGGEGLEADLQAAAASERLTGILNGCDYPARQPARPSWARLARALQPLTDSGESATDLARVLRPFARRRPRTVLTSVGRLVAQKVGLFLAAADGGNALENILERLGNESLFIILGQGDADLEQEFAGLASRHENFIYVCGYYDALGDALYENGDLFMMPSSFEPCGISQMLAMRAGQPCVVHGVGGLADTVTDDETGFVFHGTTPHDQARAFVATVDRALSIKDDDRAHWSKIRHAAADRRFSWDRAAELYINEMYADHETIA